MKKASPPSQLEVLDGMKRNTFHSMNCVQVGIIQSFDSSTQIASIKLAMKQITKIADDGTKTIRDYPLLLECPVVVINGGGDFISMPISAGDNCLVLFNDRDIDYWVKNGSGGTPTTARMHDMADGFALVGVNPLTQSIVGYLADGIRLSHNGTETIDLKDGMIEATAALVRVVGGLQITGDVTGEVGSDTINFDADITQESGREIHAGNGANGTFDQVTVVDGIVISGS